MSQKQGPRGIRLPKTILCTSVPTREIGFIRDIVAESRAVPWCGTYAETGKIKR